MKVFVVLKVAERRLLLGCDLEVLAGGAKASATVLNACFKVSFLQIIDERSLCLVSIVSHDV